MKFLCPQCSAKYKIADAKVAGRPKAKMKCRQCEHVIEIHKAPKVTESVAPGPAESPAAAPKAAAPKAAKAKAAAPKAAKAKAAAPKAAAPKAAAPKAAKAKAAAAKARPQKVGLPRPVPSAPEAAAPVVADLPPPVAFPEVAAVLPPPVSAPPPLSYAPPVSAAPSDRLSSEGGALAGFFASAVDDEVPAAAPGVVEWFVGVEGTTLGPFDVPQLRAEAMAGRLTGESLVWRDGFEDWKAASEFPELEEILTELVMAPVPAVASPQAALDDDFALPARRVGVPLGMWLAMPDVL